MLPKPSFSGQQAPSTTTDEARKLAQKLFNMRDTARIPPGKCVYIQSGDPSDFDGAIRCLIMMPL